LRQFAAVPEQQAQQQQATMKGTAAGRLHPAAGHVLEACMISCAFLYSARCCKLVSIMLWLVCMGWPPHMHPCTCVLADG
jgi:hypothetical protein